MSQAPIVYIVAKDRASAIWLASKLNYSFSQFKVVASAKDLEKAERGSTVLMYSPVEPSDDIREVCKQRSHIRIFVQ